MVTDDTFVIERYLEARGTLTICTFCTVCCVHPCYVIDNEDEPDTYGKSYGRIQKMFFHTLPGLQHYQNIEKPI
jgi:hypothetical protein